MKHQTLMHSSILAAVIIAAVICVGMVTGFSVTKPFISVDPVSDKNIGDQFMITGKTSLPAGTEIQVQVYAASFETEGGRTGSGEFTGAVGIVDVTEGKGDTNTWSMDLNTTTFEPMEYLVNASLFTGDVKKGDFSTGNINGKTTFTIRPVSGAAASIQSEGSETGKYIKVDPVADKTTGDLLIVSGSTNLPVGTALMIQAGNFGSSTAVDAGTDGVNRYSIPIDTSMMKPGTQTITVNNIIGDLAKGEYEPGTVKGTASFTLKGTFLATDSPVQATITKDDYIRLYAIGDRFVGDQFLITGTTSLPVGTMLLWQIMPDTGTPLTGTNKTARGIAGGNPVTKGDGTANRVSFAADMNQQVAGKWVVLVGVMKGDEFEMGDLTGSTYFTVK
jgi:hypothetical protein